MKKENKDLKQQIVEKMISKTEADIVLCELDLEFNKAQSIVDQRLTQAVMIKEGELRYLGAYLDFLKGKKEEYEKNRPDSESR